MFKEFEDFYDSVYRPENLAILIYCYENYEYNADINDFIEKVDTSPLYLLLQTLFALGLDSNLHDLNGTNLDWCCFQQNCHGVILCRNKFTE